MIEHLPLLPARLPPRACMSSCASASGDGRRNRAGDRGGDKPGLCMGAHRSAPLPKPLASLVETLSRFGVTNFYGFFGVMNTVRREIIVEGSLDGVHWCAYEFRYKPGDVHRCPQWSSPYHPRLDWTMWFAASESPYAQPVVRRPAVSLCKALHRSSRCSLKTAFPESAKMGARHALSLSFHHSHGTGCHG